MNQDSQSPQGESLPTLDEAEGLRPGVYRHFKGNFYRLLLVARHSETLEPMVVYQALYGEKGYWARPAAMWTQQVEHQGRRVPRFAWHGDEEKNPSP